MEEKSFSWLPPTTWKNVEIEKCFNPCLLEWRVFPTDRQFQKVAACAVSM
jgi:hypothetical protein